MTHRQFSDIKSVTPIINGISGYDVVVYYELYVLDSIKYPDALSKQRQNNQASRTISTSDGKEQGRDSNVASK